MKKIQTKHVFAVILIGCYILVTFVAAMRHEMFRDEAQAWLIARDLPFGQMLAQLRYEGHPCLWYVLLFPLAKLGLPFETVMVLSAALMGLAARVFLMRAPFSMPVKSVCMLSGLFVYLLPVVARSYALVPPLLTLAALYYPKRHEKPILYACLLLLLSQVHVLMCGLVGMLMLCWTLERWMLLKANKVKGRASWMALGIMLLGVGMLALLLPSGAMNTTLKHPGIDSLKAVLKSAYLTLNETQTLMNQVMLYDTPNLAYNLAVLPIVGVGVGFFLCWLRGATKPAIIFAVSFLWQLVLYTFLYWLSPQRILMIWWQFLFCAWISLEDAEPAVILPEREASVRGKAKAALDMGTLLNTAMLILALTTFSRAYSEMRYDMNPNGWYSNSKQVASYVQTQLPSDAVLIAGNEVETASVAAYLEKGKVYNPTRQNFYNFSTWDGQEKGWCKSGDLDNAIAEIRETGVTGPLYLLICEEDGEAAEAMLERSAVGLAGDVIPFLHSASENYFLYPLGLDQRKEALP